MSNSILYPECEKLLNVNKEHSTIYNFLEWCHSNSMELHNWGDGDSPVP